MREQSRSYEFISASQKVELYEFDRYDMDYNVKLQRLVIQKLGIPMSGAEVFEDYQEMMEVMQKSGEERNEKIQKDVTRKRSR